MLHAKRVIFAMYYSGFKSSSGYFSFFFFLSTGYIIRSIGKKLNKIYSLENIALMLIFSCFHNHSTDM